MRDLLVIFEGVDRAGKTTLVKAVQDALAADGEHVEVIKRGQPRLGVHPLVEYAEPIASAYSPRVLCDRWHVGEMVYGPIYREGSRLGDAQRAFIDGLLVAHGALLVHVTARPEVIIERCRRWGEAFLREEHVSQVVTEFARQTSDDAHWLTVDTSTTSLADVPRITKLIVRCARDRTRDVVSLMGLRTDYHGPPHPSALLVGDRPANHEVTPYAAFTPWHGNSGEYLFNALYDVGLLTPGHVPAIGFVNSHGTDLATLYAVLGRPPVVALGREAQAELHRQGVPTVTAVCHPQYHRRFRHHDRKTYGQSILQALASVEHTA